MKMFPGTTPRATTQVHSAPPAWIWTFLLPDPYFPASSYSGSAPSLLWSLSFVAVNPHDLWSYCLERIILSKLLWDSVAGLPSLASHVPGREAQILPWADFFQGMLPGVEVPTASWVMPQAPAGLHRGFHRLSCWELSLFDEGTLLREGQSETNLKSLTSASMEKSDENKVENI